MAGSTKHQALAACGSDAFARHWAACKSRKDGAGGTLSRRLLHASRPDRSPSGPPLIPVILRLEPLSRHIGKVSADAMWWHWRTSRSPGLPTSPADLAVARGRRRSSSTRSTRRALARTDRLVRPKRRLSTCSSPTAPLRKTRCELPQEPQWQRSRASGRSASTAAKQRRRGRRRRRPQPSARAALPSCRPQADRLRAIRAARRAVQSHQRRQRHKLAKTESSLPDKPSHRRTAVRSPWQPCEQDH
ncbi:hypothetical protein QFZ47_000501 [Variovorax paradoxus]|nr:hypothetical protein [Variovorax paradoxus]